ncbi:PREDICTED: transmembrane protein 62-like [Trachymyrmex septentrionalis]|uniref:transmembrane protein 62-like n=1 Tax=Trachymyrmex septentrionalis TaxID=34720 RepID=UPI00084EF92D|nr:PREDICTED: transmembrane protein 62-like [Trachymyrmex septentrionalis]XP_018352054.1 PREDICTED: transmembrane protein 62-like [Trachymyrmex septentrionalis]XP_018352055.1 PREDICTED: transmembrane protein 62-like [Trachymyrmex septentrionalis]
MKISKSTIVLLVLMLIFSILMANIADLISINPHFPDETLGDNNGEIQWIEPKYYNIANSYNHLIWFLQITDIHISIFRDPSRLSEFKEFCNMTVNAIQPRVVLASGDLTDAIVKDGFGSKQEHREWQHYRYIIDQTNVSKKVLWLDVRGNHDNFDIINFDSKNNYYLYYSIQGKKHPRSYMYNIDTGLETYSFIAIDACLKPGPKRPFNFIGILDQDEINRIQQLINRSKESNAAHAVVFGHYPTSSIISQADTNIRNILGSHKESMVYLCGHFHTLGNMVPNMYSLQKAGFLELELADWKDNRMYRLAAIDHGQFSFIDVKHNDWPVILITNPKNVLFMIPQKENLESVIKSTHVRILAFSTVPLKTVEIQLDNDVWQKCGHVNGPLYVLPWNSTRYKEGIHQITVRVVDNENRRKIVSNFFSLDGSWLSVSILPKLVLMANIVYIFQFLFLVTLILAIIPLCFLRFVHMYYKNNRIELPRRRMKFFHLWLRKLWILSAVDRVFYGLVLYTLYFAVGPWTMGEIIEDHTGVIFVWGTFIGNMYLPGGLTYAYGFLQLLCFHLPLTVTLAHHIDRRLRDAECPLRILSKFHIVWRFLPILIIILLQFILGYFLYLEYGTTAILLCPLRTGSIIVAAALSYSIATMPVSCLRSAASVWCPNGAIDNNNAIQ